MRETDYDKRDEYRKKHQKVCSGDENEKKCQAS